MGIDHTDDVSDVFKYEYYYAYNVGVLFPVPPVESPFSAALRVLCIGDNVAHLRHDLHDLYDLFPLQFMI